MTTNHVPPTFAAGYSGESGIRSVGAEGVTGWSSTHARLPSVRAC